MFKSNAVAPVSDKIMNNQRVRRSSMELIGSVIMDILCKKDNKVVPCEDTNEDTNEDTIDTSKIKIKTNKFQWSYYV